MVYLESLRIQGFQTHKDITLSFSPFFNCVVGPTRSGKSSLVRCLDFYYYNDWYPIYHRFGAAASVITGKLSNGFTLIRTKGDKVNQIDLIDPSGKQFPPWNGFGVNLPREITEILSIFPIEIDEDTSIHANVADQDDALFLFFSPPETKLAASSLRTKILSRLSGLHWIDYALKDLNKDRRDYSSEIQNLKSVNETLKTRLKDYSELDNFETMLAAAKNSFKKIQEALSLVQRLDELIARTSKWKDSYRVLQEIKSNVTSATVSRFEQAVSLYETYQKMKDLDHKLGVNTLSLKNMGLHQQTLQKNYSQLLLQLDDELSKTPVCGNCGSNIDPVKFKELIHE